MNPQRHVARRSRCAGSLLLLALLVAGVAIMAVPIPLQAASPRQQEPPKQAHPNALAWDVWQSLPSDVRAKVNPRILAEFQGEVTPTHLTWTNGSGLPALPRRNTRFLVYLRVQPDLIRLEGQVFASALARRNAVVDLLRQETASSQAALRTLLDERLAMNAVAAYQPFYVANILAVEGDLMTVIELAQRDDVAYIEANYALVPLWNPADVSTNPAPAPRAAPEALSPRNWNMDLVDADRVWQELGIRGHGAVVAGFDTGVAYEHAALRDAYRGLEPGGTYDHNYNWFEPDGRLYPDGVLGQSASSTPYDCDYYTHGTHTMGTMVGDGGVPDTQIGMAPAARWIAVPGICYDTMSGFRGDDIGGLKAFQWLLCPTDLSGDPATADCSKAPDVINNSWGSANPTGDIFRSIIQTLRKAGVAVVFSAGNPEAGPGSMGSPGNTPEAITVGATNSADMVTSYSARGPSFYAEEQKPELVAPGDDVVSSVGSEYEDYVAASGTSMAAPHVAGLIALLVSADLADGVRDFNVDELERFMTMTAVDLGDPGVDDDYGFGRIDAFAAVRWALSAGDLSGTVIDAATGAPVASAQVTGVRLGSNDRFAATTESGGVYSTTVPAGRYDVDVDAWGYARITFPAQQVFASSRAVIDFQLQPLPRRTVTGTVSGPEGPIGGARMTVQDSPGVVTTSSADGTFALSLPVGDHTLEVAALGYRHLSRTLRVDNTSNTVDLALTATPRILVVHAEARFGWFMGWPVYAFFTQALDTLGYSYDVWPIQSTSFEDTDTLIDGSMAYGTPSLDTLRAYDIVIWTHGGCFEGYLGCVHSLGDAAVEAFLGYLDGGGKMLISGQDFAQTEDNTELLDDYIRADLVNSTAAGEGDEIMGTAFLKGLQLTITNAALYGYPNGGYFLSPDAVAPQDDSIFRNENTTGPERRPGLSYPVLSYAASGQAAALATISCAADYRTVLFALGLDNVGPRAGEGGPQFAEILERSMAWLTSTRPSVAVQASLDTRWQQIGDGERATYRFTIANEGTEAATTQITIAGNGWPVFVYADGAPVKDNVVIPPCGQVTLSLVVTPPQTVLNAESDQATITLQGDGIAQSQFEIETLYHASWQYEAGIPNRRWTPIVVAQPGDIYMYAVGGYGPDPIDPEYSSYRPTNATAKYNVCTKQWESISPAPYSIAQAASASWDRKIYIFGGVTYVDTPFGYGITVTSDQVHVYDPTTDTWTARAPLPEPLTGAAAATVDDKIYVFGGDTWSGYRDSVLVYDPQTDRWSTHNPIPTGRRAYGSATVIDDKIYLVGGTYDTKAVDIYEPATDTWSETSEMTLARYGASGAATPSGFLYVMGEPTDPSSGIAPTERYDPATDTWQLLATPRQNEYDGDAVYVEGRIFYVGSGYQSLSVDASFCSSTLRTSSALALPNAPLTYTLNIFPSERDITMAEATHVLPAEVSFGGFVGTPAGATYDPAARTVAWTGSLPHSSAPVQIQYGVKVGSLADLAWQSGDQFSTTAEFRALDFPNVNERVAYTRTQTYTVLLPDFTASSKRASTAEAVSGVPFTYTIDVRSTNVAGDRVHLADRLPANLTLVPDTLDVTTGSADYDQTTRTITWNGEVIAPEGALFNTGNSFIWGDSRGDGDLPNVRFVWHEIRTTGTPIASGDDLYICELPIGFAFPFYGERHESFCVSTNGFLDFGGSQTSGVSNECPLTLATGKSPRIAAIWDDLFVFDSIYYETIGVAPDRTLLVQWTNVRSYSSFSFERATFQLALHENGTVNLYILKRGGLDGFSSSTGIEGRGDSAPLTYACDTSNTLTDKLAVRFAPPGLGTEQASATVTFQAVAGDLDVNTDVTNAVRIETSTQVYTRTTTTLFNTLSLHRSVLGTASSGVEPGERVQFTAILQNTGLKTAEGATLHGTIPAELRIVPGSVTCDAGTCAASGDELTWQGPVAFATPVRIDFTVQLVASKPDGSTVPVALELQDGHGGRHVLATSFTVHRADLASSSLVLQPRYVRPGGVTVLSLYLRNEGRRAADARMTTAIPPALLSTVGVPACGSGRCTLVDGTLIWEGTITARGVVQVRLPITLGTDVGYGTVYEFAGTIRDEKWGDVVRATDQLMVAHNLHMPWIRTPPRAGSSIYLPLVQ